MDFDQWNELRRGARCPFDGPRPESTDEWDLIAPLRVSTLYLYKNQTYRGHCMLILDLRHATRPDELSAQEWLQFCADLYTAETAITRTLNPDHINTAALGNLMPHLHWLTQGRDMPDTRLETHEQLGLLQSLRRALTSGAAK